RLGGALPTSDLRLLVVSDDAIADVAAQLPKDKAITAHVSGAKPFTLLGDHAHRGVLWPIQSLSPGEPVDFSQVPLVIEGEDPVAGAVLSDVAMALSHQVAVMPHEQRQLLHVAAVFASNFPVLLLHQAQHLLKEHGLSPDLVVPLWSATTAKAAHGAEAALTGPARRGDMGTIHQHLLRLTIDPDLRRAYAVLSDLILKTWHPELREPKDL
ncbi:MAG TPA: DUF2520 domain-containing protein, partial [Flavobacteriales bacterium]|nr:DUF2520 domain-containing protein [Flavobacteriales bacterium]